MSEATAWIVHFEGGFQAAVGGREMLHIIVSPLLEDVPQTPVTCQRVLIWENDILPVMDLTAWLMNRPAACDNVLVGIVGWQPQEGATPQYGALLFSAIPRKVRLNDEQVCDLPTQPPEWLDVAISCFLHEGQAIPILDIPWLFSNSPVMTSTGL
jgi:chemotaxis signal transduction protein